MAKFKVEIVVQKEEIWEYEVEASSEPQAKEKAVEMSNGEVAHRFEDCDEVLVEAREI